MGTSSRILLGILSCSSLVAVTLSQPASYASSSSYDGGSGMTYGGSSGSGYAAAPSSGSSYDSGYDSGYGQGSGTYFKKPVPIDEKAMFFRTPYWLPNMYYGHYGYPWTQWFDGGPRYVIPIMSAYPKGGGNVQTYNQGYGYSDVGSGGYNSGSGSGASSTYGSGSSYGSGAAAASGGTTTPDPLNDNFAYYKGVPIYQTYYEKYLLAKAASTTAAPAA